MRGIVLSGAAAVVLLVSPVLAQTSGSNTIDPNKLTVETKKPPLQLDDQKRAAIQNALVAVHTEQHTPKDFHAAVGAQLPMLMKVDALPDALLQEQPELKEYGYAKTASDVLLLDPMNRKIVAVIPRKFPADTNAKTTSPADWANTRGRELTGQAPEQATKKDHFPEPAGDAGDVTNGNEKNALQNPQSKLPNEQKQPQNGQAAQPNTQGQH